MKKRTGFVSNSSSSSFLVIGRTINEDEINESNVKDIIFESCFEGEYGQLWGEFSSMEMFDKYKEIVKSREDWDYNTIY